MSGKWSSRPLIKFVLYALSFALLLPIGILPSASSTVKADSNARGRVIVANAPGATFKQVQTDTGLPLRGGPLTVSKNAYCASGQPTDPDDTCATNWAMDVNNWLKMKRMGLNTGRIALFDFENKAEPVRDGKTFVSWDIEDDAQLNKLLSIIDQVVDAAEAAGMYAVIDYHEVGSLHPAWLKKFWTHAAPRYANRTHVLYEMVNEPGTLDNAKLKGIAEAYEIIRNAAPNTHVIHLSVNSMKDNLVPTVNTYKNIISNNTSVTLNIAAGKDSIGFHTYGTTSSNNIVTLRNAFPVICTEWGYAPDQTAVKVLDGTSWHGQVLEQKQISWFDWKAGRKDDDFENQFQHRFMAHARENNYAWTSEFFTGAFVDHFNSDPLDQPPSSNWTVVSGTPEVRPNPTNANRSVRLTDGNASGATAMSKSFPAQTHNVAFSFKFMQPTLTDFEASMRNGSTAGPVFLTKNGKLMYRDNQGTEQEIMPYSANQWYKIVLSADVATDTFDIFVNGKLQFDDAPFRNAVAQLNQAYFTTGVASTANTFVDAVRINNP